jgi:hypothetical protein
MSVISWVSGSVSFGSEGVWFNTTTAAIKTMATIATDAITYIFFTI